MNPLLEYENQWVALSADKKTVVIAAPKLSTLLKKLSKKDKNLILTKVLPFDTAYAPHVTQV